MHKVRSNKYRTIVFCYGSEMEPCATGDFNARMTRIKDIWYLQLYIKAHLQYFGVTPIIMCVCVCVFVVMGVGGS